MSNPIAAPGFPTIKCTEHSSTTLFAKYHGHIVKTFSPLPAEGKLQEIVKRVLLAVISPFAYLILACIAYLGYAYAKESVKQVPLEMDNTTTGLNKTFNPTQRSNIIAHQAEREILVTVGQILDKAPVSKIKYLIACEISDQKQTFEIDISSKDEYMKISDDSVRLPILESMHAIEKWLIEKMEIHGVEGQINIAGHAFCLAEDNILICSWKATDTSTRDRMHFNTSHSTTTPDKQHLMENLLLYFEKHIKIPLPEQMWAPTDLFNHQLTAQLS